MGRRRRAAPPPRAAAAAPPGRVPPGRRAAAAAWAWRRPALCCQLGRAAAGHGGPPRVARRHQVQGTPRAPRRRARHHRWAGCFLPTGLDVEPLGGLQSQTARRASSAWGVYLRPFRRLQLLPGDQAHAAVVHGLLSGVSLALCPLFTRTCQDARHDEGEGRGGQGPR
jgi:hypothetical protein